MANSRSQLRELKRLQRKVKRLERALDKPFVEDASIQAARINAQAATESANKTSRRTMITAIVGSVLTMTSALGVAAINTFHTSGQDTSTSTSNNRVIDCPAETGQALDIYKLHPEITIPYQESDPVQQLCMLNQKLDQVRAIDNPP